MTSVVYMDDGSCRSEQMLVRSLSSKMSKHAVGFDC